RAPTFQDRPAVIGEGVAALADGRLVTIVGLPGIGKTEVAREVARRCFSDGRYVRVIYRQVDLGWSVDLLRARLATALGLTEAPEDDLALARSFADRPTLLVLDNAEDLMRDDDGQCALRDLVDTLLAHAPALAVLVASRWQISGTALAEQEVDVPPMARTEMAALLAAEIDATGNLDPTWPGSAPWEQLLDLLDGHPRALWLMVRQLAERRATIEGVVERLQQARADAVIDPSLFGRDDVYEALASDKKARLRSLVASLDLSFDVLGQRHGDAARLFMGLSFFKGGLPEQVAVAV
ncbi:MAG: ATP-binding protein, partial [Delftia sp.]|nr:ATP-binding protein [Delftia sp.]